MKDKGEKGSFTVEAILSLSIFMFAFVTIVSLATVAKIESTTQYAIDQTAKEISKYTYIASRANLLVHPKDSAEATVDSIDEAVQSMYDFSDVLSSSTGGNGVTLSSEGLSDMLSGMSGDDFKSITASAQNVYNSFAPLMSDPKGAITALAQVVAQKGGSALVSRVIAQPLCKALLPKYITQQDDASAVLEKMGVVNGLDGLDFSLSTFLMDQRTINVVLVYEIDVKGFGIFDQKLIVKQTASTAAWLADTEGVKLSDVASKTSAWQKSDMERGKDYVSELQGENPHQGVKNGVGVDLYDQDSNTFTAVHSMNVFAASYSDYVRSGDGTKASDYILKREKIKAALKAYPCLRDRRPCGSFDQGPDRGGQRGGAGELDAGRGGDRSPAQCAAAMRGCIRRGLSGRLQQGLQDVDSRGGRRHRGGPGRVHLRYSGRFHRSASGEDRLHRRRRQRADGGDHQLLRHHESLRALLQQ